jgi:MFS family permease
MRVIAGSFFSLSPFSLWCALAQSGAELIIARLAQGATAALMVPQVLATLHLLFTDETRSRASGMYGTMAQIGNAAGVAAIGAVFFAVESLQSARAGFLVSLALFVTFVMICAVFLAWMRRAAAPG